MRRAGVGRQLQRGVVGVARVAGVVFRHERCIADARRANRVRRPDEVEQRLEIAVFGYLLCRFVRRVADGKHLDGGPMECYRRRCERLAWCEVRHRHAVAACAAVAVRVVAVVVVHLVVLTVLVLASAGVTDGEATECCTAECQCCPPCQSHRLVVGHRCSSASLDRCLSVVAVICVHVPRCRGGRVLTLAPDLLCVRYLWVSRPAFVSGGSKPTDCGGVLANHPAAICRYFPIYAVMLSCLRPTVTSRLAVAGAVSTRVPKRPNGARP